MKFTALLMGSLFLMSASMQAFAQRPERPSRPSDDRPTRPDRPSPSERPSRPESRPTPSERPSRPEPRPESRPTPSERPSRPEPRPESRPTPSERPSRPEPRPETRPAPETRPSRPEPRPETRPAPETRPERPTPRPETRPTPETRPSPRPETRPTPETRPSPRPETRPTPETRPSPRPETRPMPRPETRPEPRPETRPTPRPEPRPETRPTPRPQPRPDVGQRPPYRRPVVVNPRPNRPTPRPDVITYRHRPVVVNTHVRVTRYSRPVDYFRVVPRHHIYRRWIFQPVPRYYYPGYRVIDNYPWYIHNHYRYRYSPVETCQYDLVDSETNNTVRTYGEMGNLSCNLSYDLCANDRDAANGGVIVSDERYFCAEHVSDDYVNNDDTIFNPSDDSVMSDDQMDRIEDYLAVTSDLQAYNDAVAGRLGQCSVWKLRGNVNGCTYRMKVNGENYPDAQGLVCSAPAQADIIGCNVGSEKENIGCILKNAVINGHCL